MSEPITQSSVYDDFPKLPRLWVGYALAGAFLIVNQRAAREA